MGENQTSPVFIQDLGTTTTTTMKLLGNIPLSSTKYNVAVLSLFLCEGAQ